MFQIAGGDDVSDNAVSVEYEGGAPGGALLLVEAAVRLSDCTVGPEVGEDREGVALLLSPLLVDVTRVAGDRDDVGIDVVEVGHVVSDRAELGLAVAGEGEGNEDDERLASLERVEGDVVVVLVLERERRCWFTDGCRHSYLLLPCRTLHDPDQSQRMAIQPANPALRRRGRLQPLGWEQHASRPPDRVVQLGDGREVLGPLPHGLQRLLAPTAHDLGAERAVAQVPLGP